MNRSWPGYAGPSKVYDPAYRLNGEIELESLDGSEDIRASSSTSIKGTRLTSGRCVKCAPQYTLRRVFRSILILLGGYQLSLVVLSIVDALSPDSAISVVPSLIFDGLLKGDGSSISDAISPIACHSHNDYWRVRPLQSALEVGCSSVEADVWLEDGDLLVGHRRGSLSKEITLQTQYLYPIFNTLITRSGGSPVSVRPSIFESNPEQSLILLVDFKADGEAIWPVLDRQLQPFREYGFLTFFNGTDVVDGPLTIVASGDTSFRDVIRNSTFRDIFYDAPLELMGGQHSAPLNANAEDADIPTDLALDQALPLKRPVNPATYSRANSYYASTSFRRTIGYPIGSRLTQSQVKQIRAQIAGAHSRNLKVRYWDVPTWPIGVRNYLWRVLVREGADYLSVDDIRAVARGDWGPRKGGWFQKWWK